MNSRNFEKQKQQYFLQGIMFSLFPVTLLVLHFVPPLFTGIWSTAAGVALPLLLGIGSGLLFKYRLFGRMIITAGMGWGVFLLFPAIVTNPFLALSAGVAVIASLYYLFSTQIKAVASPHKALRMERFRGSAMALTAVTMFSPLFVADYKLFSLVCLAGFLAMLGSLGAVWDSARMSPLFKWAAALLLLGMTAVSIVLALKEIIVLPVFFMAAAASGFAMIRKHADLKYLSVIIEHPGRSVFLTFLLLCTAGTLLLRTPVAMTGEIDVVDAAFTAVSGACVTGLSTIDISRDLTWSGRFFLLILIQAGGLGIMTLAALVLHALGRLTLNQEQLLSELLPVREQDIFQNLKLIVKVTFIIEAVGSLLLAAGFYCVHKDILYALELGIFTGISAFCNAGFFPNAANMMPYSGNYFLLIVTALLIIAGGIAPAVTYSLFRAGRNLRHLPLESKLVIGGTLVMLASSSFMLLLFEWNGIFSGLTPTGKFVNGFFMASSLRTAGFNTVPLESCGVPAFIIMLLCMFIGGTPGGTAGGVKITTLALFLLALRAAIRGDENMELDRHRIPGKSIVQAVAIAVSASLVLFMVIIMLSTTQIAETEKMIFEAFSALGTVGLSMGGTGELDTVGKLVIMATMFVGRIGPLTLFLLFSDMRRREKTGYPPVRIPLG